MRPGQRRGGGQQHQALQRQQGGQETDGPPGPDLTPGKGQGRHGDGQVRCGGGKQRVGGGQDGDQESKQDQGADGSSRHGQELPAVLCPSGGSGGGGRTQTAEQAPQQQAQPLPQHGGPPPGQPGGAGERQGVDRQQHQQSQQVPESEVPVGTQGRRHRQKQVEQQQNTVGADGQRGGAGAGQDQGVPGEHGGGQPGGGAVPEQGVHQQDTECGGEQQKQAVPGDDLVGFYRILGRLRRALRREDFLGFRHMRFSYPFCPQNADVFLLLSQAHSKSTRLTIPSSWR